MNKKLLSLYGLKYNPFSQEVPIEALLPTAKLESFLWRIENLQVREGGFALVMGDPGSGKSAVLRLVAERLSRLGEVAVGEFQHPQSNVADFYRELGDLFGVELSPHNRWAGTKVLRERWKGFVEASLFRRARVTLLDAVLHVLESLFELSDPLGHPSAHLGQSLGSKHEQQNQKNDQHLGHTKIEWHGSLARRVTVPACRPARCQLYQAATPEELRAPRSR